ncbi:MAG: MerC domain-containing protein [Planctomycetota bacterium]
MPSSPPAKTVSIGHNDLHGNWARSRGDWLGLICSIGCAIHCAATPILLGILPSAVAVDWLGDALFHQIVAILCAFLVFRAVLPGYRKHGNRFVAISASIGLGCLFCAAFVIPGTCCVPDAIHTHVGPMFRRSLLTVGDLYSGMGAPTAESVLLLQPYLSPVGGFFLIGAHVVNIRLQCCRRRGCRV